MSLETLMPVDAEDVEARCVGDAWVYCGKEGITNWELLVAAGVDPEGALGIVEQATVLPPGKQGKHFRDALSAAKMTVVVAISA